MRLVKGIFGSEFSYVEGLFGIHCGQYRTMSSLVHNGGWYNSKGEKLGFGDLNEKDMGRIAKGLEKDEAFLILGERDSFWTFVTHPGIIGSLCGTSPDEKNPGIDYVIEHVIYAILPGEIFHFSMFEHSKISREELKKIIERVNNG